MADFASCPKIRLTVPNGSRLRRHGHRLVVAAATSLIAVGAANTNSTNANATLEPAAIFAERPLDLLPAFPTAPRFEPILFPETDPMSVVHQMVAGDGRIWMSARPRGETNLPAGEGRLWTYSPSLNRIEAVRGALANDTVRDLRLRSDGVWIAVDGGVVVIDPQTFVFDPFSAPQGITSRQVKSFATTGRRFFTLSEPGHVFELRPDGKAWRPSEPPAPALNPREAAHWNRLAASADWLLALGTNGRETAFRPLEAPQWTLLRDEALNVIPRSTDLTWTAALGDHSGGFWLGSDAGLHFLLAESGSMEHHLAPFRTTIPGGWGRTFGPHLRPTAALRDEIVTRQADAVRKRMRERARLARLAKELRTPLDPVTPQSRIAGGVRALVEDGPYLWLAVVDPLAAERTRVMLLHSASRKWLGWFLIGRPVTTLAADATHLYLGLNQESQVTGYPLVRIEKAPFLTVPEIRRVSDRVTTLDLGPRLAALPMRERAIHAFFAGDFTTVVTLLANAPKPDAESLFLLAFSHDVIGLNQPTKYEAYLDALVTGFPESPLTLATAGLRQSRVAELKLAPPEPTQPIPSPVPLPGAAPATPATAAAVMARRDLNKDGKLNLIEFRIWRGPNADLKRYDRNGDGLLDAEELEAVLRE